MSNPATLDTTQLIDALQAAGYTPRPYSGRGMFGASCVGVALEYKSDVDQVKALGGTPSVDALGLGTIVYWQAASWPGSADDSDSAEAADERAEMDHPNSMMYGTLPPFAAFSQHLDTALDYDDRTVWDGKYDMCLVGTDEVSARTILAKLDGHVEFYFEDFVPAHPRDARKFCVRLLDKMSLWLFIQEMSEYEYAHDGSLASCIMGTLAYEWV